MLFLLEALSSDNLVSLSEQQFVGCDTTDFGSNGGLVDNAFSFAKKPSICTESSCTYKTTGSTCQKFSNAVEISQGGVTGYTDFSKECKLAWMEALSKQPVFIAIEADQFSSQMYNSGVTHKFVRIKLLIMLYSFLTNDTDNGIDYCEGDRG